MLNVTKHRARFGLTAGLTSPEVALQASGRHASDHTSTGMLLYAVVAGVAGSATGGRKRMMKGEVRETRDGTLQWST